MAATRCARSKSWHRSSWDSSDGYLRHPPYRHHLRRLPALPRVLHHHAGLPSGSRIELFSFPAPPARPTRPEACGLRHLALRVAVLDDEVARLAALGVSCEPVRTDEFTGMRFTFLADPDGLPIELYEQEAA